MICVPNGRAPYAERSPAAGAPLDTEPNEAKSPADAPHSTRSRNAEKSLISGVRAYHTATLDRPTLLSTVRRTVFPVRSETDSLV